MGYSCTVKAHYVLKELLVQLQVSGENSSNTWTITTGQYSGTQAFYEIGQEQEDGAITGSVYVFGNDWCKRAGSFRIEPNGEITRFPLTIKPQRESAIVAGLIKYHDIHEPGWRKDGILQKRIRGANFVVID
ncbi:MAG: hypothetical protein AMJ75_00430 [Phycisphaerae bacterium SM1_79]|nr:MAG: hypothetical protein AMJ75_00430 [Phycisphaerae bacterium SM1_79]